MIDTLSRKEGISCKRQFVVLREIIVCKEFFFHFYSRFYIYILDRYYRTYRSRYEGWEREREREIRQKICFLIFIAVFNYYFFLRMLLFPNFNSILIPSEQMFDCLNICASFRIDQAVNVIVKWIWCIFNLPISLFHYLIWSNLNSKFHEKAHSRRSKLSQFQSNFPSTRTYIKSDYFT